MKKILMAVLVSLVAFTACENYGDDNHKFDNVVYLDVASTSDAQFTTFSNTRATYDCALQAVLTYPAGQDVAVTLTVDPSLAGRTMPVTVRSGRCSIQNIILCCPKL